MKVEYTRNVGQTSSKCEGISMGYYVMRTFPTGNLGTDSLGSCFAFVYVNRHENYVLMAHVATDGDTDWIHKLNLSQGTDSELFYIVTGKTPNKNTYDRINKLKKKYHIEEGSIKDNKDKTSGVMLSINLDSIKIEAFKEIDARNNGDYKEKTNLSWKKGSKDPLIAMTEIDKQNYLNEFESGD